MTAVELLIENLKMILPISQFNDVVMQDVFKQAKEMEKQQIIDAYFGGLNGSINDYSESKEVGSEIIGIKYGKGAEKYYNETYGSKGSDETNEGYICPATKVQCDDECCVSAKDCHIQASKGILSDSSQTEISDEEIEKGAWENPCLSRQDVYELFDEVFKDKTLEGMFKISASKEVRQFKERLRQLAKEKYREQLKQRQ